MLEGLERNKTPLSDHLHAISSPWTADYTLVDGDHTLLFETSEILVALAYLTIAATKEDFEKAHASDYIGSCVWSPWGRAVWDRETRNRVLSQLEQPELRTSLLAAGFARGDDEHLSLATESIRRVMDLAGRRF